MRLRLKFLSAIVLLIVPSIATMAQSFSLDSCRSLALKNNKQLMISRQGIRKAEYQKKEAFAAYLPAIDFAGGYTYNQKKISIFDSDQLLPVGSFNPQALVDPNAQKYNFGLVKNPETGLPIMVNGQPIPEQIAIIPKEAMTYDIHNVFFGAITLTQPIYMGGKIKAMNDLTGYAKQLAEDMHYNEAEHVVYAVDGAYWQVVSLKAKRDLAVSFVAMLDTLDRNVGLMLEQGGATRADKRNVDVKLNQARVDLTKVENGLALSRMALAQVCGLPINSDMHLVDEPEGFRLDIATGIDGTAAITPDLLQQAYQSRSDLKALESGIKVAGAQKRVALSAMLPNVALVGAYSFSNPNMFYGFSKKFSGAFSVGAMVTIPIWHWGGNYNKYKAAESDEIVMKYRLEDARDLVNLQVNQAAFKARESVKTLQSTESNLKAADENLRCADIGFKEGVLTTDDVLGAQTAWLKAYSENVDAMIEVRLCNVYLSKVLGTLVY